MIQNLEKYSALIFDCDGVVLNSNQIKSYAFYETTKSLGSKEANELVDYHISNGGISRYLKFQYFLEEISPESSKFCTIESLLNEYSKLVKSLLLKSEFNQSLYKLWNKYGKIPWLIVSGGDQKELRDLFRDRNKDKYFQGGIYGSPKDKISHFRELVSSNFIHYPLIYFGDSKYDYLAAKECDIDFCFVSQWTEFKEWKEFCISHSINHIENFDALI